MIGVLILTHGRLADELLAAAHTIAGDLPAFSALALEWGASPEDATKKIEAGLNELEQGDGVLILTDMYGSTPSNLAMSLCQKLPSVEVVTGVNLPMVVRLACARKHGMGLAETTDWISSKARKSIRTSGNGEEKSGRDSLAKAELEDCADLRD